MTSEALTGQEGSKLLSVAVKDTSKCLALEQINIGNDSEACIKRVKSSVSAGVLKTFYLDARSFYQAVTSYLQERLPLNNSLLRNLQYLHPPTARGCNGLQMKQSKRKRLKLNQHAKESGK